jgi:hypothetical protein
MKRSTAVLACTCLLAAGCADLTPTAPGAPAPVASAAASAAAFPTVLALPTGFGPEGIDFGRGPTFYVGSIPSGAVYRGDARTGAGAVLVPPQAGRQASGLKYDGRRDRLFVAGGLTGQAYVYDAATGATLATYQLTAPGTGLVNDVVLTRDAAYFTDSFRPVLYRVPLAPNGDLAPGGAEEIPLSGDYVSVPGQLNGNGIAATPDGRTLLLVNSATGALYRVDPATGVADQVDLGGRRAGRRRRAPARRAHAVRGAGRVRPRRRRAPARRPRGRRRRRAARRPRARLPVDRGAVRRRALLVNARFDDAPPPAPAPNVEFQVVRVSR